MATKEELLAEIQRRGLKVPGQEQQPQGGANALIGQLMPKRNAGTGVGDFLTRLGGGKPDEQTDLSKIYAQEAIKSQFKNQNKTAMTDNLPPGFVNVGGKAMADPDYIDPMEQRKLDADQAKADANAQKKLAHEEELKNSAQENLNTIEEVKKGSKFFGPLGDAPSKFAPSSFMGMGDYKERANWESNINRLLSQKAIDVMTEMKAASKTGATGFGQLSEKELAVLQQASTALNRNLDPQDAMHYLDEMEKIHRKVLGINGPHVDPNVSGNHQAMNKPLSDEDAYAEYLKMVSGNAS